jgi:hypothetical protein
MAEGDRMSVVGRLTTTEDGERAVIGTHVTLLSAATPLRPLGLRDRQAAGSDFYLGGPYGQPGVGVPGLNNVGLLVCVWGKVEGAIAENGTTYLLINDGSSPVDRLRVDTAKLSGIPAGYVRAVGISSIESISGRLVPVIKPRRSTDVQILSAP